MSQQLVPEELILRQSPEVQAIIRMLLDIIDKQNAKIAELEARLNQSPRNSSLPPSTEHPHAKPPPAKTKSKKKRGGQPGHKKHERDLIPTEQCREVIDRRPEECRRCHAQLQGDDSAPLRHQVWELPVIAPDVAEYRLHRLTCPDCGVTTCGTLPDGVPTGCAGPRLTAFTGLLMGYFRQSKRRAAMFLQDLWNFPCCPATTVKMQNQVSAALAAPCEELKQALATQPQLNMDETPTKQGSIKAWLWTAVAPLFAVFAIFSSRKGTALPALLGEDFAGIINCDRAKMYWQAKRLQWCWAHLMRDFQALADHSDRPVRRAGRALLRDAKAMFAAWKRYKSNELDWTDFQTTVLPIRRSIEYSLLNGAWSGHARLTGMCEELWKHRDWLWTFVDVPRIEPTNNAAERALRPAVIYRKLSFGTQSASGSRFVERMLTMSETCRLQGRSTFAYLVSAVEAHFAHRSAPSLLPGV